MARTLICKLLQRKTYDVLSQKYTIFALFAGVVIIIVSLLHFGETMLNWSREKYSVVFYPFSDNIAGKNFQNMLCQRVPIDVVYTWVNGTDPKHLRGLAITKRKYGITELYTNTCELSLCVDSYMVIVKPELPHTVTLDDLEEADSVFGNILETFVVGSQYPGQQNITVLVFRSIESASQAAKKGILSLGTWNYTLNQAFLTDNWLSHGTVALKNTFIFIDIPSNSSESEVKAKFPSDIQRAILKVYIHPTKNLAIIVVTDGNVMDKLNSSNNSSLVTNKSLQPIASSLVIELPSEHEDISASRFADNEELRYSLRSLEKHAPWVQHVYIVTNGQIPYWLNLDNPRVSIITHEEIFSNKSHLPTFSSPAIECHLHRIPNLSKKFLYLNDDVMFGKDVWPEDFYTHSRGQKVYLSWPVPNCAEGCPSSWIRDGYCDKPCNNSFCQWDGGDCTSDNPVLSYHGVVVHEDGATNVFRLAASQNNCNEDCLNTWLADKYCDKACNVRDCGYDAGDCGVDHYNELPHFELLDNVNEFNLPEGEIVGFINLTKFIHNNYTITEGFHDNHAVVRALAISLKFSVLTIVLNSHYNTTRLTLTLKGKKNENPFEKLFYLTVNTEMKSHTSKSSSTRSDTTEESIMFEKFPEGLKFAKVISINEDSDAEANYAKIDVVASNFSERIVTQIQDLDEQVRRGELTEMGYWRMRSRFIKDYILLYHSEHKQMPSVVYNNNLNFQSVVGFYNMTSPERNASKVSTLLLAKNSTFELGTNHINLSNYFKDNIDAKLNGLNATVFSHIQQPLQANHTEVFRSRTLSSIKAPTIQTESSFLYETPSVRKRNLLDTFGDSLRHVNKLYNEAFGYEARKVPSHIAHFIDKDIMERLYNKFNEAFDVTSSHKIRRSNDMQFAFSYYYYMMSEMETVDLGEIFDIFDVDSSGTWSDREIRTLLTRLHDLPLANPEVNDFHQHIINCSAHSTTLESDIVTPHYERYYESNLPTVTKALVLACGPIANLLKEQFGQRKRNQYEIFGEDEVAFKMIHNNLTHVLSQIDDIRKSPKKFICLNDNMKHGTQEAEVIRSVIQDFYESLFPTRSQFELDPDYRNRFLYMEELQQWRKMRDLVRFATYLSLGLLILFTVTSFWKTELQGISVFKIFYHLPSFTNNTPSLTQPQADLPCNPTHCVTKKTHCS